MAKNDQDFRLMELLQAESRRYIKADMLAASAIREAIIKGIMVPGQEIDEEMIARNLNISRMPVRQALGILEAEGIVKRPYRKGAVVTELTAAELEELYNVRAYLEGLAIRRAVPNYSAGHLQKLKACLAELSRNMEDPAAYLELNNRFHALLYEPCEWERLLGLITQLRNNSGRYMILAHTEIIRNPPAGKRHQDILATCARGDAARAEELVRNHILNAMEMLLATLTKGERREAGGANRNEG